MTMTHPGLPYYWGLAVIIFMVVYSFRFLVLSSPNNKISRTISLISIPVIGSLIQRLVSSPWVLLILKLLMVVFFLTVIISGLFGTQVPERNFATVVTWNIWWAGLVFSIFLFGSAWCAICPWDAMAQWLVRRRLFKRAEPNNSLNLSVPSYLKSVWPALFLFIALTWLELGVGTTVNPYATAVISLLMVLMATLSLSVFKRKAFCKHFCPVGRTIGFYAQLAPLELRPINTDVCSECKTLDCYHGNEQVDPCPTSLVMGTLTQNTYCTSCGNCTQSCPEQNIAWRLREPSVEAIQTARPHWDEAWFMLGLLALTAFHGISMLSFWEEWLMDTARSLGDSGQMLISFTLGMVICFVVILGLYTLFVVLMRESTKTELNFRRSFSSMAFVAIPLAFSYHMAHNLNHLIREGAGLLSVFSNPLGKGTLPLTMMEKHQRHFDMLISQDMLFSLQALLMILGFAISLRTIRHRGVLLMSDHTKYWGLRLSPIIIFAVVITGFHLWMLMQPMTMRM